MRKLDAERVVIASQNQGKIREFRQLMATCNIETVAASECGLPSVIESENTFAGNASLKAQAAAALTGMPAISDDSGIEVEALGGLPGVKTADWAETSRGRDYVAAMTRVWDLLESNGAPYPRRATFCSTICVAWPDGHQEFFTGFVDGHLTWPMRGELGFGFDPIFVPDGYTCTFGEMPSRLKNTVSHRARALASFARGCLDD